MKGNMIKNIWKKIWRDDEGKVVIWQLPNKWLYGWAIFTFIALLFSKGTISNILTWLAEAALIIWCYLEILKGVNYFSRALGIIVLFYAVKTVLRSF